MHELMFQAGVEGELIPCDNYYNVYKAKLIYKRVFGRDRKYV